MLVVKIQSLFKIFNYSNVLEIKYGINKILKLKINILSFQKKTHD